MFQFAAFPSVSASRQSLAPVSVRIKDPGSALTHFIGIIASVTAAPFILRHYAEQGADAEAVWSVSVFLFGMLLLYTASTAYHTFLPQSFSRQLWLKRFDHMMIFILIAASYTPLCLTVLRSGCGPMLLAFVWALALAGMLFKLFWVCCPKWVSSVIYVVMGWLCVLAFPELYHTLSHSAFLFLLWGGIVYTIGGVIYAMKFRWLNNVSPYFGSHEIFHLFVLAGNALQFIAIYLLF